MTLMPYRCVVIGCGWIGAKVSSDPLVEGVQSHAEAYDTCTATTLVGLCDTRLDARMWACSRWPAAQGYDNVGDLLACEKPDIVSICTPDETHDDVCRQVLAAPGVQAIILEKPIATDTSQAMALLAEAERKNIAVLVNYSRRFSDSHMTIKKRIVRGDIGQIIAVSGVYSKGVLHNGSHWFDLVRWMVGEIVEVEAWDSLAPPGIDPTCHVRVCFETGVQGFLMGVDSHVFSIFELDLIGSLGRFRIRESGHQLEYCCVQKSEHYTDYSTLSRPQFEKAGFENVALRLIENTVQCLRGESVALCSGRDGLAALRISEMVTRSLHERQSFYINFQKGVVWNV